MWIRVPALCRHRGHDLDPVNRGKRGSGNSGVDRVHCRPTTRGLNDGVNHSEIGDAVDDAVDLLTVRLDLVRHRVALETVHHHHGVDLEIIMAVDRDTEDVVVRDMATHHLIGLVVADTVAVDDLAVDFEEEDVAEVMDREEVAGRATRGRTLRHRGYWAASD